MNPYLTAHAKYQAQQPDISWTDALDFHLQHGLMIANDRFFVMARPVPWWWPEEMHLELAPMPEDAKNAAWRDKPLWHVWMAAGDLMGLLSTGLEHGIASVSYVRRSGVVRERRLADLNGRAFSLAVARDTRLLGTD